MDEGFDREFYRCRWRLVLPVGPDGIQPYVRATRGAGSSAGWLWKNASICAMAESP